MLLPKTMIKKIQFNLIHPAINQLQWGKKVTVIAKRNDNIL